MCVCLEHDFGICLRETKFDENGNDKPSNNRGRNFILFKRTGNIAEREDWFTNLKTRVICRAYCKGKLKPAHLAGATKAEMLPRFLIICPIPMSRHSSDCTNTNNNNNNNNPNHACPSAVVEV